MGGLGCIAYKIHLSHEGKSFRSFLPCDGHAESIVSSDNVPDCSLVPSFLTNLDSHNDIQGKSFISHPHLPSELHIHAYKASTHIEQNQDSFHSFNKYQPCTDTESKRHPPPSLVTLSRQCSTPSTSNASSSTPMVKQKKESYIAPPLQHNYNYHFSFSRVEPSILLLLLRRLVLCAPKRPYCSLYWHTLLAVKCCREIIDT